MTVPISVWEWVINKYIFYLFLQISQPCEEMIIGCNFGGADYNCKDIFRTIVTDEGLCCVFNKLDPNFMYKPKYVEH